MGFNGLNHDGSPKLNTNNNNAISYTHEDTIPLRKAWTDFMIK